LKSISRIVRVFFRQRVYVEKAPNSIVVVAVFKAVAVEGVFLMRKQASNITIFYGYHIVSNTYRNVM